jgi:hypothetical protein
MPKKNAPDVEPLIEKRIRYPQSVVDWVKGAVKENRGVSESAIYRALAKQGIRASVEDWAGRDG